MTKGNTRFSDGLISVSSLPQSRSSSAQDSYSTSATTYDDLGDGSNQRPSTDITSQRQPKPDSKGNVLVSVRVRPDTGNRPDAEWMVDGRKSLISYSGKEGGDYYYGRDPYHMMNALVITNSRSQIMSLHQMMITREFMTILRNA